MELPERDRSLVHDYESEWRKRQVNVMKVFKSLVNQLTEGADLTRISMPSEICHPFSVLEVVSHRELSYFPGLFSINDHPDDSLERFLSVIRWFISCLPQEQIEKKPFNPTIGEEHLCWLEHDEDDWTEMIAEQVSHHPPLSAFLIRNEKRNISLQASLDFTVSFGGANHVVITSGGNATIDTGFEKYTMSKLVPSLIIQRIIFGVKYYMWDGEVVIECPSNGLKLNIFFSEKSENKNKIKGHITQNGVTLFIIGGVAGKIVHYWKPDQKKKKIELYNFNTAEKPNNDIVYPPPESRKSMNSLRLWKDVADAVIKDDMNAADIAKRKIEHEQRIRERKREAEGAAYKAVYFDQKVVDDKTQWLAKDNVGVNKKFIESLKEVVRKEKEEQQTIPQSSPLLTPSSSSIDVKKEGGSLKLSKSDKKQAKGSQASSYDEKIATTGEGQPGENQEENCLIC